MANTKLDSQAILQSALSRNQNAVALTARDDILSTEEFALDASFIINFIGELATNFQPSA